jgi:hypothetical protein
MPQIARCFFFLSFPTAPRQSADLFAADLKLEIPKLRLGIKKEGTYGKIWEKQRK